MHNRIFIYYFFIISLFIVYHSSAQTGYTTNNNELENHFERLEIMYPNYYHFTGVKPFERREIAIALYNAQIDSNIYINTKNYIKDELYDMNLFKRELLIEKNLLKNLYRINTSALTFNMPHFSIRLNPILELKFGKESQNNELKYFNTRGIELSGCIDQKLNFYTQLTENQIRPFQYISEYGTGFNGQNQNNFNPYYTYWKDIHDNKGYDFSNAIGYLEYSPSSHLSIMMGHDRNHYGYGYRSLLLGDNGSPYFQLKMNAKIWKLHYQALFAEFTGQYIRGGDKLLPKKYGAFHLLTYKPTKKLEFGVYEGVMFHRDNGFELNYLNPVIFYHTIEHAVGSSDNVMMGAQAKYQPNTHTQIYSQLLIDDMQVGQFLKGSGWWGNKYGVQLGSKFINIANINTLDAQVEMNLVNPFTYSHYGDSAEILDNFTHYNQPLAHPFGANFIELMGRISYKPIPKLRLELKYNYSAKGMDMNGLNYGNNLFSNINGSNISSEFNNSIAQGDRLETHFIQLNNQFMFLHNMYFDLDFIYRNSTLESTQNTFSTLGVLAGIRVNLRKRDYMF